MTPETFASDVLPLKNKLFRYAKSILENGEEAKDVVQETLMKVWEKKNELGHYNSLEAYCMTVTRNFALGRFRHRGHKFSGLEMLGEVPEPGFSSHQAVEWKDTFGKIEEIVARLPLKQKEVFQLRDIEEFSYQEICDITGYDLNDVKVSIFRARKMIKEKLIKIYDHEGTKNALG